MVTDPAQHPTGQVDLDEVWRRVEAATPGPWTAHDDGLVWPERMGDPVSGSVQLEDAEFIAHARTDVPALLADLDAATARAERAEHILQRVQAVADRGARVSLHRATWVSLDALLQALGGTDGES